MGLNQVSTTFCLFAFLYKLNSRFVVLCILKLVTVGFNAELVSWIRVVRMNMPKKTWLWIQPSCCITFQWLDSTSHTPWMVGSQLFWWLKSRVNLLHVQAAWGLEQGKRVFVNFCSRLLSTSWRDVSWGRFAHSERESRTGRRSRGSGGGSREPRASGCTAWGRVNLSFCELHSHFDATFQISHGPKRRCRSHLAKHGIDVFQLFCHVKFYKLREIVDYGSNLGWLFSVPPPSMIIPFSPVRIGSRKMVTLDIEHGTSKLMDS